VNPKIPLTFLMLVLLSLSVIASVQSQSIVQSKSGDNHQISDLYQNKSPSKKPDQGIATGKVSELDPDAKRWALIIGISDYAGTANDLNYCDDDAVDFCNALVNVYGWDRNQIILLIDSNATKQNILQYISHISGEEKPGDEVVFFYSGHGSTSTYDVDGDGEKKDECIIPYECQSGYFIWDGDLKKAFSDFESTRMMFFFDSCYSGGMMDLASAGRLILMACGERQLSTESSVWGNGQFTYYFVDQGMLHAKADSNGDRQITFEEAFDYAKANCRSQTPVAFDAFQGDMLP